MSRETSLDEFAAVEEGDDASTTDDGTAATDGQTPDDGARPSSGPESSSPEPSPVEVTMAFVPGGATCGICGATVERRWRDGDHLVCVSCKSWSGPRD